MINSVFSYWNMVYVFRRVKNRLINHHQKEEQDIKHINHLDPRCRTINPS